MPNAGSAKQASIATFFLSGKHGLLSKDRSPELGTWSPLSAARTQPAASEAERQSKERPGSLMAMTSPQRLTQAEAIFFFPQAFYLQAVQWSKLNMIMC